MSIYTSISATDKEDNKEMECVDKSGSLSSEENNEKTVELKHSLEAGDHIIRWSHFGYMYPIQIHGIVLETSSDGSIKIVDFGLTKTGSCSNVDDEQNEQPISNSSRRLNVITLTNKSEIKRWRKVNYGGSLFKSEAFNFEKLTSWFPQMQNLFNAQQDSTESEEESKNLFPVKVPDLDDECSDFLGDLDSDETSQNTPESHSPIKLAVIENKIQVRNLKKRTLKKRKEKCIESRDHKPAQLDLFPTKGYSIFGTVIFAYPRKKEESQQTARFISFPVSLPPYEEHPKFYSVTFPNSPNIQQLEQIYYHSNTKQPFQRPSRSATSNSSKKDRLPDSDPATIVLARVQFLLQNEDTALPSYHVFYSNSECIAVWCKTGRWSTLQTAVFLHSTAVGNAKQTFLAIGGVAALNPLLITALAPLGIVYIGAPWLYLKKCKDKWEAYTSRLTDAFWAWADPEVFVEAINQWSDLS